MRLFWGVFGFLVGLFVFLFSPALAQDRATRLADIRLELAQLQNVLDGLQVELTANVEQGSVVNISQGGLARVQALEAELARLTNVVEQLEFRITNVVRDGTNQVGDLRLRLCELTPECDLSSVELNPSPLGGAEAAFPSTQVPDEYIDDGDVPDLAILEQSDLEAARAAYDLGDFHESIERLQVFLENYGLTPLAAEANYLLGSAYSEIGDWQEAANAFLRSFSGAQSGPFAPDALFGLGNALSVLGHNEEACIMFSEVSTRFPETAAALDAQKDYILLDCF